MKPRWCASYKHVTVRPIGENDIEKLRLWRNNQEIKKFLSPIPEITKEMQENWYRSYLTDSNVITYAIDECEELNRMVGTVSLYDFDGCIARAGKTIIGDPDARGKNMGYLGETLALYIGYQKMGISKYLTEVHEDNIVSQKMAYKIGFRRVGKHKFGTFGYEDDFVVTKSFFEEIHDFLPEVKLFEA